ncbi:DNA ligase (ATP) [Bulinus truncatus]|nr:DNA ligase (ATP) [Bulinus truncatus]
MLPVKKAVFSLSLGCNSSSSTVAWQEWSPNDMIHLTEATKKIMEQKYDEFGDSYTMDVTEENLKRIFERMDKNISRVSQDNIREIEEEYFPDDSPYGLFRLCKFYIDNKLLLGDPDTVLPNSALDLLELEVRFFGAEISDDFDSVISHVIINENDLIRLKSIKEIRHNRHKKFHIVTAKWVKACIENGDLVPERTYEP